MTNTSYFTMTLNWRRIVAQEQEEPEAGRLGVLVHEPDSFDLILYGGKLYMDGAQPDECDPRDFVGVGISCSSDAGHETWSNIGYDMLVEEDWNEMGEALQRLVDADERRITRSWGFGEETFVVQFVSIVYPSTPNGPEEYDSECHLVGDLDSIAQAAWDKTAKIKKFDSLLAKMQAGEMDIEDYVEEVHDLFKIKDDEEG